MIHAVSDTLAVKDLEQDTVFRRALVFGSRSFILETYARFPEVFNAKKRPNTPYATDIGTQNDVLCASHKPRKAACD